MVLLGYVLELVVHNEFSKVSYRSFQYVYAGLLFLERFFDLYFHCFIVLLFFLLYGFQLYICYISFVWLWFNHFLSDNFYIFLIFILLAIFAGFIQYPLFNFHLYQFSLANLVIYDIFSLLSFSDSNYFIYFSLLSIYVINLWISDLMCYFICVCLRIFNSVWDIMILFFIFHGCFCEKFIISSKVLILIFWLFYFVSFCLRYLYTDKIVGILTLHEQS